jgi:hypothetical protein
MIHPRLWQLQCIANHRHHRRHQDNQQRYFRRQLHQQLQDNQ